VRKAHGDIPRVHRRRGSVRPRFVPRRRVRSGRAAAHRACGGCCVAARRAAGFAAVKVSALGRTSLLERMTVIITHIRDLFRKFSQARAALLALGPDARVRRVCRAVRSSDVIRSAAEQDGGDRKINFEQFSSSLQQLGVDVSDEECRALFRKFDADNNGVIGESALRSGRDGPLGHPARARSARLPGMDRVLAARGPADAPVLHRGPLASGEGSLTVGLPLCAQARRRQGALLPCLNEQELRECENMFRRLDTLAQAAAKKKVSVRAAPVHARLTQRRAASCPRAVAGAADDRRRANILPACHLALGHPPDAHVQQVSAPIGCLRVQTAARY
jgi:hypothetical protein